VSESRKWFQVQQFSPIRHSGRKSRLRANINIGNSWFWTIASFEKLFDWHSHRIITLARHPSSQNPGFWSLGERIDIIGYMSVFIFTHASANIRLSFTDSDLCINTFIVLASNLLFFRTHWAESSLLWAQGFEENFQRGWIIRSVDGSFGALSKFVVCFVMKSCFSETVNWPDLWQSINDCMWLIQTVVSWPI
jgi:hypothetical protein